MSILTGVAMYFVIWWTVLFAVLPIGTRPVAGADAQSGWRGAPARPRMWRKAALTSLVAAIVWVLCWLAITSSWLGFRSGILAMPQN